MSLIILSVQMSVKHMLYSLTILLCLGVNPCLLKGQKTGVFVGAVSSETEQVWCYRRPHENGYGLTGCVRAMLANQISYWLGVSGKLSLTHSNKIVVDC
jgi:fatty acid synthase